MSNSKPFLLRIDISKKYFHSVFLIRSYGAPNGARRCSVVYCYDKTWATLAHSKMSWHCELLATTHYCYSTITDSETKLYGTFNNYIRSAIS